jgi:dihydroneopterin aldolase
VRSRLTSAGIITKEQKMHKSLQSSDDPDYVLIHKKALLVNALAYAHMSTLLSRLLKATDTEFTRENLAQEVADVARDKVNSLSQEEVNANVQAILDDVETEKGLTIVIPGESTA